MSGSTRRPPPGPSTRAAAIDASLVAFDAVAVWFAFQATGCAWRGVGAGEWILVIVAALAAAYGTWLVIRPLSDDLIRSGDVVLSAIFAFAISAAVQWAGRWSA